MTRCNGGDGGVDGGDDDDDDGDDVPLDDDGDGVDFPLEGISRRIPARRELFSLWCSSRRGGCNPSDDEVQRDGGVDGGDDDDDDGDDVPLDDDGDGAISPEGNFWRIPARRALFSGVLRPAEADVTLTDALDSRTLLDGSPFSTKGAYLHIQSQLLDPGVMPIWQSKVPRKVKVFGWLLHLNRLNTRANMLRKHIIDSALCPRCKTQVEDRAHLFFTCPFSAAIWRQLRITPSTPDFPGFWHTQLPNHLPRSIWNSIALIILWKIWDARNAKVFRDSDITATLTVTNIVSDFTLWSHRFRQAEIRVDADLWRNHLSTCTL
ncbi:hypothetical protein QYE76_042488 [Lolium multiflorum]|uniref:Reverse transcriptase zinc-binding domain-containing protein n=1 Tax=Lolium multiflorum TaxID=4521 RepID=A0AAD8TFF8_LOLMU|nr:hypothetical protein QYE76_042488 [Lolium multiflorum]